MAWILTNPPTPQPPTTKVHIMKTPGTYVIFEKLNRKWVAQLYRNDVCVSWQTVGTRQNVDTIIREQLIPNSIPATIQPPIPSKERLA